MPSPEAGLEVYLVGGAVRDALLGREVTDRDWVVVGATPQRMLDLGFKPVGKDFPVFLHPESHEEYALARTERKVAPGYTGFSFDTSPDITLEQDLQRRDLTINAIARDVDGEIIDPFNGAADIRERVLRHVSDAFSEDPVRVLRVARFAARFDFQVANETNALIQRMAAGGEVDALVAERVWAETDKALGEPRAWRYFEVLRDSAALRPVFPEIDALFGVPQTKEHHPEVDTGVHTMMVLRQACRLSDDPQVRFAALVHDLGKALTPAAELPRHRGHEKRGVPVVERLCERLRVPKAYRQLAVATTEYHLHVHRMLELRPETVLKLLHALDAFRKPERYEQFLLACEADMRGRPGYEDRDYPKLDLSRDYLRAAGGVDAAALARDADGPNEIQRRIAGARIEAIRQAKHRYLTDHGK